MDLLSQHEAFLQAIFDAPNEYTHRLVYADFLDENDLPLRAEVIRVQCELVRLPDDADPARRKELEDRNQWLSLAVVPWDEASSTVSMNRGLCGARRIRSLDLRNNNLDNDAAQALVKSPYLDNLTHLQLLHGNRLRG